MNNLLSSLPHKIDSEIFENLVHSDHIKIERILSKGHSSPASGWYDQDENEWILVLKGSGVVVFDDGNKVTLKKGDYLNIPARKKHKVSWTDPKTVTVWLAIFYR